MIQKLYFEHLEESNLAFDHAEIISDVVYEVSSWILSKTARR